MAYFNDIKPYLKRCKEYFELIIRDTFFLVEGDFKIIVCKENFIYLIGKKEILFFHGKNFKLCQSRRLELVFSGCIYRLDRKDKCKE